MRRRADVAPRHVARSDQHLGTWMAAQPPSTSCGWSGTHSASTVASMSRSAALRREQRGLVVNHDRFWGADGRCPRPEPHALRRAPEAALVAVARAAARLLSRLLMTMQCNGSGLSDGLVGGSRGCAAHTPMMTPVGSAVNQRPSQIPTRLIVFSWGRSDYNSDSPGCVVDLVVHSLCKHWS